MKISSKMIKSRIPLFLIPLMICFIGCRTKTISPPDIRDIHDVISVTTEDTAMNNAIRMARTTLYQFETALQAQKKTDSLFSLKLRFEMADRGEHIWLSNVRWTAKGLAGIIDNEPVGVSGIKPGDTVNVDGDKISDWMYEENDKTKGGFTIRLLRVKMSVAERKQFDTETKGRWVTDQ